MTCLYDFNVWVDLTLVTYFGALTCHCIAVGLGMNYVADMTLFNITYQHFLQALCYAVAQEKVAAFSDLSMMRQNQCNTIEM